MRRLSCTGSCPRDVSFAALENGTGQIVRTIVRMRVRIVPAESARPEPRLAAMDVLVGFGAVLLALVVFDVLALLFGVDTRYPKHPERRDRPLWWS